MKALVKCFLWALCWAVAMTALQTIIFIVAFAAAG